MDFKNRLKGNITQSLVETLLEDVNYRIVPLGIEEIVREVKCLDQEIYLDLGLSTTLRKLPDFFISKTDLSKSWLVEVKYRRKWNESVRDKLGKEMSDQITQWEPLHLVIFLGEPARPNATPASFLAVCKLVVDDGRIGIVRQFYDDTGRWADQFVPWPEVKWDHFARFQDVFNDVSNRWEERTLIKAIELVKGLNDLE